MKTKVRNNSLDTIKGIACILIVFMHCEFPGALGQAVQAVSRFCVPFFFMVSGYFSFSSKSNVSPANKIKHIARITLFSSVFYLIVAGVHYLLHFTGYDYAVSFKNIRDFLVFNEPVIIAGQLWFLFALLYTYVVFGILHRNNLISNAVLYVSIALLCGYIFLSQGLLSLGMPCKVSFIYRNWLFEGIPYFFFGYFLHKFEGKIKIRNSVLIVVLLLSTICVIPECYFLGRDFGINLCSIPQVFSLFILGMNNPTIEIPALRKIGKDYSMFVYILHPFVWHILENVYRLVGIDSSRPAMYIMPILVAAFSIGLSPCVIAIHNPLRKEQ